MFVQSDGNNPRNDGMLFDLYFSMFVGFENAK